MVDQKSIARLMLLHPSIRDEAIEAYTEAVKLTPKGVHPFIDQTVRTFEESNKLYAQGRTIPGQIVTNAKAGQSLHNYGLALDFHLQINGKDVWSGDPIKDKNWMIVVNCFKKRGFEWGGDWLGFKDYPHLQKTLGYTWQKLLAMHDAKKYIPGQTYVDLA